MREKTKELQRISVVLRIEIAAFVVVYSENNNE